MKVNLIQTSLHWENASANRKDFEQLIATAPKSDLIVLPEMFTTGFSMNPSELAETMTGETVSWMIKIASENNSAITGSVIIREGQHFYNRLLFVKPSGDVSYYDKRHLFSLAREDKMYTRGNEKLIVDYLGWKICPFICYDLRFPVFSRNVENYDLALYVANWPAPRINAWDVLLKARAVENMSYVVGVNRIGDDANNISYPGHSQVIDAFGNPLNHPNGENGIISIELNKDLLAETRKNLAFLDDRDSFTVN